MAFLADLVGLATMLRMVPLDLPYLLVSASLRLCQICVPLSPREFFRFHKKTAGPHEAGRQSYASNQAT